MGEVILAIGYALIFLAIGFFLGRRSKKGVLSLLYFLVGPAALAAGPADAAVVSLKDALPRAGIEAEDTRYLWQPGGFSPVQYAVFGCLQPNLLSRESEIVLGRRVSNELVAIKLSDYGIPPSTWEKLVFDDPYFHEIQIIPAGSTYRIYWRGGGGFKRGWYPNERAKAEVKIPISARWITNQYDALVEVCNSTVPLVRADWFFSQTAVSENRTVGYYGMLGIKSRADAERLAGLDRKVAEARKKVMRAVLIESGVAINNRQIEWLAAYDGDWWATLDSEKNDGRNNTARLLDDAAHDAEEIYYRLPNGLPGMVASDAKGGLQKTVPDKIAHDKWSRNDRRIHVPLGCMTCHVEVIRPFECDARRLYRNQIRLESVDPIKFIRQRQLYLSDIYSVRDRSAAQFADAIRQTTGMKTADVAQAYGEEWDRYYRGIGVTQIAGEMGLDPKKLRSIVSARIKGGLADPVLSCLDQTVIGPDGKPKEMTVRREYVEEFQGLIWSWVLEAK